MRFGEHALLRGWITAQDLDRALELQGAALERIGTLLVRMGALSRRQRLQILSDQSGLPFRERLPNTFFALPSPFGLRTNTFLAERAAFTAHKRSRRWFPAKVRKARPFWEPVRPCHLAIPDPMDVETVHNLRAWKPKGRLLFYDFQPQTGPAEGTGSLEQATGGLSSPLVDWLDEILAEGVRQGASDLHFVRERGVLELRIRVFGRFRLGPPIPGLFQEALVPRIKVMAGLDVAEERLPQDGSFERRLGGKRQDFRVSILPGVDGEGAVLRILGGSHRQDAGLRLEDLDMPPLLLSTIRDWALRRAGIVLITGPTGSGKTTTLYALLRELDRTQLKIVTLEDPVEYALEGAHQVQVNPEIGLSFAQGLRAILRHDPDVILVGEIRDRETAEIALRASLTGHLVLSTLHTNRAVGAFSRLHDMGIPTYLLADAVLGVLAQRLVGRTCRTCRGADRRCPACGGSGIDGRLAVFEGGPCEPLRPLLRQGAPEETLVAELQALGFPTLIDDARRKASQGLLPETELRAAGLWEPNL